MVIAKELMTVIKALVSVVTAVMLLMVHVNESNLPSPDGAEVISKNTYVLLDEDVTTQGVTNDGEYFYFSGKHHLGKADMKTGDMITVNLYAIPDVLSARGCNHIGGLSWYNGYIYAAVEDGPDYRYPYIVVYDAETLEFTGEYHKLPQELHTAGVPWCAVDGENNRIYTAEWNNAEVINYFDLTTFEYEGHIKLSRSVDQIQGAELYNGKLYLSCDEQTDEKPILAVDLETGVVETAFSRNVGTAFEAEDVTIAVDEEGFVFYVLDRGAERNSTNLTGYRMSK